MQTSTLKKITFSTVKSFIKTNEGNLFINVMTSFCGMTDSVESINTGFSPIQTDKTNSINSDYSKRTRGIKGAWFVGESRDYFAKYEDANFSGIEVSNSCGRFILASKK